LSIHTPYENLRNQKGNNMACSGPCNGYYHCGCDIIAMKKEVAVKKMEVELLEYKIKDRIEVFNRANEGRAPLMRPE
jgi:hypothetical protein